MRACPRCHVPLEPVPGNAATLPFPVADGADRAGIFVDVCSGCDGLFLDGEEFGHLTGKRAVETYLRHGSSGATGIACPGCGSGTSLRAVAGTVVDACAGCGGLWFDPGEAEGLADLAEPRLRRY